MDSEFLCAQKVHNQKYTDFLSAFCGYNCTTKSCGDGRCSANCTTKTAHGLVE